LQAAFASAVETVEAFEKIFFPRPEGQLAADSERAAALPDNLKSSLKTSASARNRNQLSELEKHFESSAPDYFQKIKQLREIQESRDQLSRAIARVMIMEDMKTPRKTFLLERGLYNKPGEEVLAAVPVSLPPLPPDAPPNRLALAHWLVSPQNPLAARVTVNRFWQQFFGTGLVKTPEDFGVQGEFPVHPELLEWLASDFIRSGWNVKQLCRAIVTSATYRQSSKVTSVLLEKDPENRLLARAPRYRWPSWMIRDQALAASGLLVFKQGGPPVKPYQPPGVWEEATFGNKKYVTDAGEKLYRRSLYTFWRRIVGPTLFFDSAPRQVCTVKQLRTNSPLHALATLNDITYVEAARALAEQVCLEVPGPAPARIHRAFERVLSRPPAREESSILRAAFERLQREFAADAAAAEKFLSVGESKRKMHSNPIEHAALTGVCNLIFNLDETLTKE
jgi:hypothetical protein